jgi:hypothetical protein
MNTHPYLRAYMAGTVVPSLFLLIVLTAFVITRYGFQVPVPIERVIVFPMALVPNLFGLWNVLYVWSRPHPRFSLGLHGALLPFILMPLGALGACALGFLAITSHGVVWFEAVGIPYAFLVPWFAAAVAAYYLVWKYVVGFFNRILGIA